MNGEFQSIPSSLQDRQYINYIYGLHTKVKWKLMKQ
jgi:hypothetical protein